MKANVNLFQIAKQTTKRIKVSSSRHEEPSPKNDSLTISAIKYEGQEKSDFGFSTLLNISASTVGRDKKSQYRKMKTKQSQIIKNKLFPDIDQMREKLRRIQEKPLILQSENLFNLNVQVNKNVMINPSKDRKNKQFVQSIKKQIMLQNINKFQIKIKKVVFGGLLKELTIWSDIHKMKRKRSEFMRRRAFVEWKRLSKYEQEKKLVMEAIRNRLIERRKQQNMLGRLR